jgi:hypothetical protein
MARTADGVLHVVYQTSHLDGGVDGLAARSISPAGKVGPQVQAVSGWQAGKPGLIALANGTIEAVFGAIAPAPSNVSAVWAITSSDGGATWSPPANVKSGPLEALAYGSDVTAQLSGVTPVLTLPQAGNLVVQQGLGANTPTAQVNGTTDGALGNVDSTVDGASGEVVAGWQSLDGAGGDYLEGIAPTIGTPQLMPGPIRSAVEVTGSVGGPGVFAGYSLDNKTVRLQRYGGGSVAVGSVPGITPKAIGVAAGPAGRIWVMWGDESGGFAFTRSNKAVTAFEPIQHFGPTISDLWRISGDGKLGPLDVIVDGIPNAKGPIPPAGSFHGRVLPELSATVSVTAVKNKKGKVIGHKLGVKVTDAGDPVAGAAVSVKGQKASTNASGSAKLALGAGVSGTVVVSITSPGYMLLQKSVTL